MKRLSSQVNHKAIAFILITLCGCKNEGSFLTAAKQEITASAATSLDLDSSNVGAPVGTVYTYTATSGATHDVVNLDMGADFLVTNICSTRSILSLTGTAICNSTFGDLAASNMYRNFGTAQMTLSTETSTSVYAAGYRNVPNVYFDDDGYWTSGNGCTAGGGLSDTCTPIVRAARPLVDCGTTQTTIAARIADCLNLNGSCANGAFTTKATCEGGASVWTSTSTWEGATSGTSSEGTWKLVTRTADSKEVWRDEKTGLLWGDTSGSDNWCKASGNSQADGYCDGNTQSYCAEGGGLTPAIAGEDWTPGTAAYDSSKGGMGNIATVASPSVKWRIPTRNDWLQAEINGVRFVLPNTNNSFWSATVISNYRGYAWSFDGYSGDVNYGLRYLGSGVRCLGR